MTDTIIFEANKPQKSTETTYQSLTSNDFWQILVRK